MMNPIVQNKKALIALLHKNRATINSFGVKQLGIFGSFVRDEANSNSDIDFYIEFYPELKSFDNFMDLAFFLKELVGRKIEIVTPQSLSRHIGPNILKEVQYVSIAA